MSVLGLRLPDIKPPPSPNEHHKRLIEESVFREVSEEARFPKFTTSSSSTGYKERTRSRPRVGSSSLDDFLSESSTRPGARGGRPVRSTRPTGRQAIDDETSVPMDVFQSMLKAGQDVRGRATHTLSFKQPDGRPYLKHHDAEALLAAVPCPMDVDTPATAMEVDKPTQPATLSPSPPLLPPRPSSSCASELAERWDEAPLSLQVGCR